MATRKIVNVGLIGCGEVAQTIHIPTLNHFSDSFRITYLCDVSHAALAHCASKVAGAQRPKLTQDATELCTSPEVEVVFILSSTEYHATHAVQALSNNKTTFIEKPMAMNNRDVKLILEAERGSTATVFVGYMRRYATAFLDAVQEIGGMEQITYARVRDIIGRNAQFIAQSGSFPKRFDDYSEADSQDLARRAEDLAHQGLQEDLGVAVTKENKLIWSLLGGLGSHDLSVMREALGMPKRVLGCHLDADAPFWTALFQYPTFACHYESGVDEVPRFDAHLQVYSKTKEVLVQYDNPYIKGLPITLTIKTKLPDGGLKVEVQRKTYEDPYTLEYKELYALVTEGKKVKTSAVDAAEDLRIFQMIMREGTAQFER